MRSRGRATGLVASLALLLLLTACGSGSEPGDGLERLTMNGWRLDYPSTWHYYPMSGFTTSFYAVAGYLGSTPVDTSRICDTTPTSQSCNARAYDLPPGNVVLTIGNAGWPLADPVAWYDHPTEGTPTRVGGMATIFSEDRQSADRVVLTWKIAAPIAFGNWVQLDADIRGPGAASLRAQVEALVASFHFIPDPTPISDDPAVAQRVARTALAALKTMAAQKGTSDAYACFPDEAGATSQAAVTSLPFGPPFGGSVAVTCSAAISPTDVGYWKLDLTITWEASAGREAGSDHIIQWLEPDGTLSGSTGWNPGAR